MKLIKQNFKIIDQEDYTLEGIKKFIERCGRVCYKSECNITDNSYEKFVDMLINKEHYRPLEFGTVYLKVEGYTDDSTDCIVSKYINNPWSKVYDKYGKVTVFESEAYITTNYRVIIENGWEDDLEYLCAPTMYHCKRHTVHMVLSRGVMDEFRTHVSLSHLAESTRYCNYSKDKFDNELTFIIPSWLSLQEGEYIWEDQNPLLTAGLSVEEAGYDDSSNLWIEIRPDEYIECKRHYSNWEETEAFMHSLQVSRNTYLDLLNAGWKPQQARAVLPLAVKSELISCGFSDAWSNFFFRRCAKDAHPMAREIAQPLHEEFIKRGLIET